MSERAAPIAERGPPLPANARAYRTIGPFGADAIPAGLLRRHDLKDGAWGLLSVSAGSIRFHWDDDEGGQPPSQIRRHDADSPLRSASSGAPGVGDDHRRLLRHLSIA